jgi:hypothetical protein
MEIFELVIDEQADAYGIQAISLVAEPAIEADWVALSTQYNFQTTDKERRVVMGPALIPDKPIYRRNDEQEFHIWFSKETVRKAMELYFKAGNQNRATLEHEVPLNGTTVIESWIVEGEQDKSRAYGMNVPKGTWMVSMKIDSEAIWEEWVKENRIRGFSIEGMFTRKVDLSADSFLGELEEILEDVRAEVSSVKK